MKKFLIPAIACGLMAVTGIAAAAQSSGVVIAYHEKLDAFVLSAGRATGQLKPPSGTPDRLSFDAFGRRFEIELERNDRLLSDAARNRLAGGIVAYRGRLAGQDTSWVRIVIADGIPRGVIWDGIDLYAIEAPGDSAVQTTLPVAYRLADTYLIPGAMSCGTDKAPTAGQGSAASMYGKLLGELETAMAQGPGASVQLDLGAIGDSELFEQFGSDAATTEAAILTRLNTVDGIFSEQLGVQIFVDELAIFTGADDPFSDTTDSGNLLDELAEYRSETPAQRSQGLTHLYTGRNLDDTTVGIAYLDALCLQRFGAGLSEGRRGATTDALIAAHEIGHNFGAEHDGEENSVCESTPETFLMAASVNNSDEFSQCSIDTITPNIAAASCIAPLPAVDMSIALDGDVSPVLLGTNATLTFRAANSGTQSATGVEVDVELPDNATLVAAAAESGSCTSGAGEVNCTLDTVPAGSTRDVTLTTLASDTGSGTFTATVLSDSDVNLSNNAQSVTLTVNPAVDLVVNMIAASQVNLNQQASIAITLENRSVLDASDVILSISLSSGLRADIATWPLGNCTVSDRQVDCEATSFTGQSDATLSLSLTGIASGESDYTVSLSSSDEDTDNSNNSVTASVQVSAMNSSTGSNETSGGSGTVGYMLLVVLSGIRYRRTILAYPRLYLYR